MGKIILYTAVSIDGYIAGDEDDLSWLYAFDEKFDSDSSDYEQFYNSIEKAVMGNGTYRYVVKAGYPDPYPEKATYVFTRDEELMSNVIDYVHEDPVSFTRELREKTEGNIWLVGGGKINGLFLEAGIIDELQLMVMPVTVGSGCRLFEGRGPLTEFSLACCEKKPGGSVKLIYDKKE